MTFFSVFDFLRIHHICITKIVVRPYKVRIDSHGVRLGDGVSLEKIEEEHIRRVSAATKSLQEAADILGIDQATLWRRRKKYGI